MLSLYPPVPVRVPDRRRAAVEPAAQLRLFPPPPPAPTGPPPCDNCGCACDTLHYDREGEGELLCGPCARALTIDHAPADLKPIRLIRPRVKTENK